MNFYIIFHFQKIINFFSKMLPLGPLSFSGVEVLTSALVSELSVRLNCFSSRQYPFSMESYSQSDLTMLIRHFLANSYFAPEVIKQYNKLFHPDTVSQRLKNSLYLIYLLFRNGLSVFYTELTQNPVFCV